MARFTFRTATPEPTQDPPTPGNGTQKPTPPAPQPCAIPWAVRIAASERNDLLLEPALSLW